MRGIRSFGLALAAVLSTAVNGAAQDGAAPPVPQVRITPGATPDSAAGVARLSTVRVIARARPAIREDYTGFDERSRRKGFGQFLTAKMIESTRPPTVPMALTRIAGIQVVHSMYGTRILTRGYSDLSRRCEPSIYLDGSVLYDGARVLGHMVQPHEVRGVEVYLQLGTAPPPFDRNPCGSVLVWTKLPETKANLRARRDSVALARRDPATLRTAGDSAAARIAP